MYVISIHAPTRGATNVYLNDNNAFIISIHAPTRGATSWTVLYPILILFQSTLPREERHLSCCIKYIKPVISIHAPTRGATRYNLKCLMFESYFNPRSHERSDDKISIFDYYYLISIHAPTRGATGIPDAIFYKYRFQSTLPREERQI